jgi:superfamily II DNA/RNA helicase
MISKEKWIEHVNNLNIDTLNPLQEACFDHASGNNDLRIYSRTGSGKTLAFLSVVLHHVQPDLQETQVMIVAPTRELVQQIEDVFRKLQTGLRMTACYGGHKREIEENNLKVTPQIIIGTTGRLGDHIRRKNFDCSRIQLLVLDEFDKMFELMSSATKADFLPEFLASTEKSVDIDFSENIRTENQFEIFRVDSSDKDKHQTLFQLLCSLNGKSSIVFFNHREHVEKCSDYLKDRGLANVFYHGALMQQERDIALAKFRNGSQNTLLCTDLASRGLDIQNVRNIIHFHLPVNEESYTHRNGRSARMEASGRAFLVMGPEEYIPEYIQPEPTPYELSAESELPAKTEWVTLFIHAGKKEKIGKTDILGFMIQIGQMKKEDIGLIEQKDHYSLVAVRRNRASLLLSAIDDRRMKNKKVKFEIAR